MNYAVRGFIDELVEKRQRHKDLTIRYEIEKGNLITCMFSIDDVEFEKRELVIKGMENELERLEEYFETVYYGYTDNTEN